MTVRIAALAVVMGAFAVPAGAQGARKVFSSDSMVAAYALYRCSTGTSTRGDARDARRYRRAPVDGVGTSMGSERKDGRCRDR
jgi:hypothetical protein